jgi:hypothetical protein
MNLRNNKFTVTFVLIVAILAMFSVRYGFSGTAKLLSSKLSLSPKPENYTEMYFEDPTHLPKFFMPEEKQRFSFTLHNTGAEARDYAYQAFFVPEQIDRATTPLLKVETLHVPARGYATREIVYRLSDKTFTRGTIVVRLPEIQQEIHFNVTKIGI